MICLTSWRIAVCTDMELTAQDKLLCSRVEDFIKLAQERYQSKCTFFLDERQQALCIKTAKVNHFNNYSLSGGYPNAQRRVFGVFDEFTCDDEREYGICAITCTFADFKKLTHRDFLGTLMSLGIKRECVGDILVEEGKAVIFVTASVEAHVLASLTKVGNMGIKLERGIVGELPQAYTLVPVKGTVSSMRLDCLVAMLTGLSREKSTRLIEAGQVFLNYIENDNQSAVVSEKDVLTVRGYGKFIVESVNGVTKKGRYSVTCNKFV